MESGNRPPLWFIIEDVDTAYEFSQKLLRDRKLGLQNWREFGIAEDRLRDDLNVLTSDDVPLPPEFPVPRLALPRRKFAPDYLGFNGLYFCSRRLRDALAQPDHVVQFAPVELVSGGADAQAQDYRLMRVLAKQLAMDLMRSNCCLVDFTNRITGQRSKRPKFIEHFVLRAGLQPRTDIFRIEESSAYILAADAVADRVLRAGCTGIEFSDLDNLQTGMRVERYRTATGIAERRVGFLD